LYTVPEKFVLYSQALSAKMINQIYSELRQQIVDRLIPPGTKLSEARLSAKWRVSRTPIREVLRRLESEGLVNSLPYRGFIVNSISIEDVVHIYTVKSSLEGLAGRLATPMVQRDPAKLKTIRDLVREMEICSKKSDVRDYSEKNLRFHVSIWDWCGNPWLTKILNNLSSQLNRFIVSALHVPNRMERSVKEHRKILEAFTTGNAKAVEKAVASHFKKASEDLISELMKKAK
jgi:DNA-binding GntR family transcriptional regulator